MTDNELYSMFITVGQIVSAKIMRDKSSGYSYGYGFVHYQQPEDAAKAIASLNGLQVIFKCNLTKKLGYGIQRRKKFPQDVIC